MTEVQAINAKEATESRTIYVTKRNGEKELLDLSKIERCLIWASTNLDIDYRQIYKPETLPVFDGISTDDIQEKLAALAATMIKVNHDWSYFSARLILQKIYKNANNSIKYSHIKDYIEPMVEQEILSPKLLKHFDLEKINRAIVKDRDFKISYMSLTTLADRYLLSDLSGVVREKPQHFFMRVAMGLALAEKKKAATDWAIRFYNILSTMRFMSSTPTLFNAGTLHPQLSSCFLMEIGDGITEIFDSIEEAAQYSKFSGGTAMSLTPLRAKGSFIKSTKGVAGGVVPYAKMIESTMLGFDQSGKRAGSCAVYLEPWHADIEEFLQLAKSSGDPRRRTPDLFLANWINDLFIERVNNNEMWSLFSPYDTPDLKDLYGKEFEEKYVYYEQEGKAIKQIKAKRLWNAMLTCLFNDQGMGWPCFKDECNRRSMTRGYGVIHSSNLCTEITLRTNHGDTSAVCNLGSVNLAQNVTLAEIEEAVRLGVRMIDNAVEIGFLPHENGKSFNKADRPLGLGVMGYTEWLTENGIDFESEEHLNAAHELFEKISFWAIDTSADLAVEKGSFPRFEDSQWSKGELPFDTANKLIIERLGVSSLSEIQTMPWDTLRKKSTQGMRNSQLLAIAPTATIANICDTTNCTELPFDNYYEKGNMSGTFDVASPLVRKLKGTAKEHLIKVAREVDMTWVVLSAAVRQIYVDQSQSTNVWVKENIEGKALGGIYLLGHRYGVKTFYYLRSESTEIKTTPIDSVENEDFVAPVCNMEEGCVVCQ